MAYHVALVISAHRLNNNLIVNIMQIIMCTVLRWSSALIDLTSAPDRQPLRTFTQQFSHQTIVARQLTYAVVASFVSGNPVIKD